MPKTEIKTVLSPAQQELIEASIAHLLNFPSTASALIGTVQELIACIKKENLPENCSEDIQQLIDILYKPTEYLFRLEKLKKEPVTIADVQDFILTLITEQLETAAKNANILLDWPQKILHQTIVLPEALETPFISKVVTYSSPHPQELVNNPENIYFANLTIDEINRHATISITTTCPNGKTHHDVFHLHHFDETVAVVKRGAEIRAELTALKHAILYLIETKTPWVEQDLLETVQHLPFLQALLLDKTYLSLLDQQNIFLNELTYIDSVEYQNLSNPSIKSLIAHKRLSLHDAKELTTPQKLVLTQALYFSLFKERHLWLSDLIGLKLEQSKVLAHPVTIQLIQSEKLTFRQAKRLPEQITQLFSKNMYQSFFLKKKVNWRALNLLTESDFKNLLDDKIIMLLNQELITVDALLELPSRQLKNLMNDNIHALVLGKHLSLTQLTALPEQTITRIKTDSRYVELMEKGRLSFSQLQTQDSYKFFTTINSIETTELKPHTPRSLSTSPC